MTLDELPRITKRELERVGIRLIFEDNVREWMHRGWMEIELCLFNHREYAKYEAMRETKRQLFHHDRPRLFEEDGA
jgi:hypothetical protein